MSFKAGDLCKLAFIFLSFFNGIPRTHLRKKFLLSSSYFPYGKKHLKSLIET